VPTAPKSWCVRLRCRPKIQSRITRWLNVSSTRSPAHTVQTNTQTNRTPSHTTPQPAPRSGARPTARSPTSLRVLAPAAPWVVSPVISKNRIPPSRSLPQTPRVPSTAVVLVVPISSKVSAKTSGPRPMTRPSSTGSSLSATPTRLPWPDGSPKKKAC